MNAVEFVRNEGWDVAQETVKENSKQLRILSTWEVELKRLVESWELVEKVGGLTMAKDFYKNFECVHIGLDLIQCRNLGKAIADVESVGGGV
ncbi:hypothetical protein [Acinetobacter bereziniae]|uniref:hypothetical protein n=1 Tax=Acinetobacter bereziniae TaxID=106648 RepID=UPI00125EB270|nr:hypothetical protein [Acinetobacter bereziniae]